MALSDTVEQSEFVVLELLVQAMVPRRPPSPFSLASAVPSAVLL